MSAYINAGPVPRQGLRALAVACAVFFISGMPALVYQLAWQRSLFTLYGINVESVAIVVTGFMFGLGLGSLAGGQLSRSGLPLLLLFGLIELAIGVFGAASLGLFDAVGHATIHSSALTLTLAPLVLLLLPTLLMGSTLPILTLYVVRRYGNVGKSLGLLYLLNTLGSAVACFVVAFWLMRALGLHGAVLFAAAFNFLVGGGAVAAWLLDRNVPGGVPQGRVASAASAVLPFSGGMALAAITGYVSLSYEILWFRTFSVASGGSAMAFALVLGAFLVGVAGGSGIASYVCVVTRSPSRLIACLAGAVLFGCLSGYATIPLAALAASRGTAAMIVAMLSGVCIAAGLIGAAFPLAAHLSVPPDERAGARVSYLYMSNVAGAVLGSMTTGFFLMDRLTLPQLAAALTVVGLALVGYLAFIARGRMAAIAVGAIAVLAIVAAPLLFDGVYERLQTGREYAGQRYVRVLENRQGLVTIDSHHEVLGGGMYDGYVNTDLVHDANLLLRPFSLSMWHAQPRQVLMIGMSMGAWAQVIASHPQVERLTIVEINPGYATLMQHYPEVRSLLSNPKVEIVVDDGRRWMNRHPGRKFDVIVQNTTWHFRAHVSSLLSQEYLALAKVHLERGGIMLWNTTSSERARKTACQVFPHGYRFVNAMVAGVDPITPNPERLTRVLSAYRIDGRPVLDLSRGQDAGRLKEILAEPREPCAAILARTAELDPITDDNMGEEWRFWRDTPVF